MSKCSGLVSGKTQLGQRSRLTFAVKVEVLIETWWIQRTESGFRIIIRTRP